MGTSRSKGLRQWLFMAFALPVVHPIASAQNPLAGRVLDSLSHRGVAGAVIFVPGSDRSVTADSGGHFVLQRALDGDNRLIARAIGFRPETVTVRQSAGVIEIMLRPLPAQSLDTTRVMSEPRSRGLEQLGFYDRQRAGAGHFIDRATLAKAEGSPTHEVLSNVAGMNLMRAGSMDFAWSTRATSSNRCAFCRNPAGELLSQIDINRGAKVHCYMDVYLDGNPVYQYGRDPPMDLFDLDSLNPADIEGIEIYSSAAQMPPKFNRTSSGCGAIVI